MDRIALAEQHRRTQPIEQPRRSPEAFRQPRDGADMLAGAAFVQSARAIEVETESRAAQLHRRGRRD